MGRAISLAFLTLHDVDALEAMRIAAQTGFEGIGLRLLPAGPGEAPYPLLESTDDLREARAILRDTGLRVADVEIVRLGPATDIAAFEPFLARAAELGARHVLVAGDDPDHGRLAESYAKFCALAAPYGLTGDLEFMPWTGVRNLSQARAIVKASGAPNAAVLVDALHFDRSDSGLDELAGLPAAMLNYAQLCDGPADYHPGDAELIRIARSARQLPGEGGIDLAGFIAALPADLPLSVEVPDTALAARLSPRARAERAFESTRRFLDGIAGA